MTPNEYQQAALRTEHTPLFVRSTSVASETALARILHGMIGICTEAGELQDQIKKHLIYGKTLDGTNVVEEISDVLWYCALTLSACGVTMEDCMQRNIAKLKARYPEKFSEERALVRDLDAERAALTRADLASALQADEG